MDLNFVALHHILVLGDGVGDDHGLEVAGLEPGERVPREYPVGQDGVDLLRSVLTQLLRCLTEREREVHQRRSGLRNRDANPGS